MEVKRFLTLYLQKKSFDCYTTRQPRQTNFLSGCFLSTFRENRYMKQQFFISYCLQTLLIALLIIPVHSPAMNHQNKNLSLLKIVLEEQFGSPLSPKSPSSCGTPTAPLITIPPTQLRWLSFLKNSNAPSKTFKLINFYKKDKSYFKNLIENEKKRIETVAYNPIYESTEKNRTIEYQKLNSLVPHCIVAGKSAIAVVWEKMLSVIPRESNLSDSLFETALQETPSLLSWSPQNHVLAFATDNELYFWSKAGVFEKSIKISGIIKEIIWAPNGKNLIISASENHWATIYFCSLSMQPLTNQKNINKTYKLSTISEPIILTHFDDDEDCLEKIEYSLDSKNITITGDFTGKPLCFDVKSLKK